MIKAYRSYWENILNISGTATRAQYWWPQVVNYLIIVIFSIIAGVNESLTVEMFDYSSIYFLSFNFWGYLVIILSFCIWLANFTVRARRLHDTNRSNWWILLYIVPFFGPLILFIFLILPSTPYSRWRNKI